MKGNPDCQACGLYRTAQAVCLFGQGPVPAKMMIVGEAPGFREDEIGKPFQGAAGQLLDQLLESSGLRRRDIYITNVCKCRPPNNRTPGAKEMKACKIYLQEEFVNVKPKFVLLLGATALKGVLGKGKITEIHGQVIEKEGITYIPTFHPAAALRDPRRMDPLERDIKTFANAVKGRSIKTGPDLNWTEIRTFDQFNEMLTELREARVASFDIETTGLDRFRNGINCLGLAIPGREWILPLEYPPSPFYGKPELQKMMIELVGEALEEVPEVVGQYGKFDVLFLLYHYGVRFKLTFDTGYASHLIDENIPSGLKYQARLRCGAPNYDLSTSEKKGNVNPSKLYKYCAMDVHYTLKLRKIFRKMLKRDDALWNIFHNMLMPATQAFIDAENEGVFIHLDRLDAVEKDLLEKIRKVEGKLAKMTKPKKVNWNSPKQVAEVLFKDWGLKPIEKTKGGDWSTAESILKQLADEHYGVELLLKYREHFKQYSSFVMGWKKRMWKGRIHPSFKLNGTVTGRLSCVDPNLQQVPRDSSIRSLIGAPPGWTFVEADYSQIELKIAAMISGERNMLYIFQTGGDIHTTTAKSLVGADEVTPEQRKAAKAVNFGFLYGMGHNKFMEYARDKYGVTLTPRESKAYRQRFFDTYPDLPRWHEKQRKIARMFEQVRNPIGRLRRLPEIASQDDGLRSEAERQAINSPVQGFGSDLTTSSVVEIHQSFSRDKLRIIGSVHDSILMIVKDEYVDEVLPRVKRIMESPALMSNINFPVPITVEIKTGNWGTGKLWTS